MLWWTLRQLKSTKRSTRYRAAQKLSNKRDARAVEPLVVALKDEDKEVQKTAARALGWIGDARAVEPLVVALKDEDKEVQETAAMVLGEIGDARAVEPLVVALKDEDKSIRRNAANALERIGGLGAEQELAIYHRHYYKDGRKRDNKFVIHVTSCVGVGDTMVAGTLVSGSKPRKGQIFCVRRTGATGVIYDVIDMQETLEDAERSGASVTVMGDGRSLSSAIAFITRDLPPEQIRQGDEIVNAV